MATTLTLHVERPGLVILESAAPIRVVRVATAIPSVAAIPWPARPGPARFTRTDRELAAREAHWLEWQQELAHDLAGFF